MRRVTHRDKCDGALVHSRVKRYVLNVGIDGVLICDAVSRVICKKCCEVVETVIPSLGELVAATALARVQVPMKLNNKDICFLRKALGWQSKTLAKQLGVVPETISRWASADAPVPITPSNEKLLRLFVVKNLKDKAPGVFVDPEEILEMEIPAFRKSDDRINLTCWRIFHKKSPEDRPTEVWDIRRGTNS